MARVSLRRIRPLALLLAGAMLGASVSIVSGAIPSSVGQINACYNKTTGALRVIDYPTVRCKSATEKFLRWNVKGAAGVAGTPGGPAGANGVSGYEIVVRNGSYTPAIDGVRTVNSGATCPAGKVAVGGGGRATLISTAGEGVPMPILESAPNPSDPATWSVTFSGWSGIPLSTLSRTDYTIFATCMTAS